MKTRSQRVRVLEALERGNEVCQFECMTTWRPQIMRLGAVIKCLRDDGYLIKSVPYTSPGGAKTCRYVLIRKPTDPVTVDRTRKILGGLY